MKKTLQVLSLLALASLAFTSCKKNKDDDPKVDNPVDPGAGDEENVTRVSVVWVDSASNKADTVSYRVGQSADSLKLKPNTTYLAQTFVFDDTKNLVDTISHEIKEEGNYHRFHYSLVPATGSAANIKVTLLDLDTHTPPQPIGLEFKVKTGVGSGQGNFNINLRHFHDGDVKTDDIAGGEQDIYVNFPTVIK